MKVKRDTSGIERAAHRKRLQTLARAEEGIQQLIRLREPITFTSVADIANVSTSWLYRQPELVERIEAMRFQQPKPVKPDPIQTTASFPAQDKMIQSLRHQAKALKAEVQALTQQIEALEEINVRPAKGSAREVQRLLEQVLQDLKREKQKNQQLQAQVTEFRYQLTQGGNQVVPASKSGKFGNRKIGHNSSSIDKSVATRDLQNSLAPNSKGGIEIPFSPAITKGLEEIQIKPNKGVRDAIAQLTEEQVLAAIAAFKEQASKPSKVIESRRAYFVGLLHRQAEPNEEDIQNKNIFNEWFELARVLGIVLASTINRQGERVCYDPNGTPRSFQDYWLKEYPIEKLERRASELINY